MHYSLTPAKVVLLALSAGTLAAAAPANSSSPGSGPSNMTITAYSGLNCNSNGTGATYSAPVPYNENAMPVTNGTVEPILSYTLSRNTDLSEQLDFSGPTKGMGALNGEPSQCTLFHETTSPDSNGNPLSANVCYGLLLGPAEVRTVLTQTFIKRSLLTNPFTVPQIFRTQLTVQAITEKTVARMGCVFGIGGFFLFVFESFTQCSQSSDSGDNGIVYVEVSGNTSLYQFALSKQYHSHHFFRGRDPSSTCLPHCPLPSLPKMKQLHITLSYHTVI